MASRSNKVPALERFWAAVKKSDGCWEWQNAKRSGYGVIMVDGESIRSHRYSW